MTARHSKRPQRPTGRRSQPKPPPPKPPRDEQQPPDVVPEVAMLGLRPMLLPPGDDGETDLVLTRLRGVRGVRGASLASPEDDPGGNWEAADERIALLTGADIYTYILITIGGLIWLLWQIFRCEVITLADLNARLSDGDRIRPDLKAGTPGVLTVTLRAAPIVTWWKDVEIRDANDVVRATAWTQDAVKENTLTFPSVDLKNAVLVFGKAKQFGIHSIKYLMPGIHQYADKHLTLTWEQDHA
jgi:hypothetical protein